MPTVIQLCDGNSIINTYNAEGVKLSTTYYTLPEAVTVPVGKVLNPDTLPQAPLTMTVQYMGNLEKTIINDSVSYTLHIPEGYISMDSLNRIVAWNYFRRDHLGNNVAVWNATADTTVQRMCYYPSGLPMAVSLGQGAQPYKYNDKEYDEMHGYDVYDYGFRGYYASIARFTSIDPLCERTPWQSPYCYASNNFVGEIDWMGLMQVCNLTCVNGQGVVVFHDPKSTDHYVYRVEDDWEEGDPLTFDMRVGIEIPGCIYIEGISCDFWFLNGDYYSGTLRAAIAVQGRGHTWQFGFYKDNALQDTPTSIDDENNKNLFSLTLNGFSSYTGIYGGVKCNEMYWYGKNGNLYTHHQIHKQGGFANSYKIAKNAPIKIAGNVLSVIGIAENIGEIAYTRTITPSNAIGIAMGAISFSGIGAIIAGGYFVVDTSVWLITGCSIGDRLDNKYGSYYF